jgi:hypothetical protein
VFSCLFSLYVRGERLVSGRYRAALFIHSILLPALGGATRLKVTLIMGRPALFFSRYLSFRTSRESDHVMSGLAGRGTAARFAPLSVLICIQRSFTQEQCTMRLFTACTRARHSPFLAFAPLARLSARCDCGNVRAESATPAHLCTFPITQYIQSAAQFHPDCSMFMSIFNLKCNLA